MTKLLYLAQVSGLAVVLTTAATLIPAVVAGEASAEKRIAQVVGNGSYAHISPLTNPKFDAELMARSLGDVGFDVALATDADRGSLTRSIQTALSNVGCNPGAIDGKCGRISRNALEQLSRYAQNQGDETNIWGEPCGLQGGPGCGSRKAQRTTVRRKQQQPAKPVQRKKQARRATCPKGGTRNAAGKCVKRGVGAYYYDCEFKSDGC